MFTYYRQKDTNHFNNRFNLHFSADENTLPKNDCQRISVVFENHSYVICLSNKKIFVVKRAIRGINNTQSSPSTQTVNFQPENNSPNGDHAAQQASA